MNALQPKSNYLSIIEDFIATIGQNNKKKILRTVLPYVLAISNTEAGALLVAGDKPGRLNVVAIQDISDEVVAQLAQGDLGHLLLLGKRLWIKLRSLQLNRGQALLGRHRLKYLFGVPFHFEGQVLGAIVVVSRVTDNATLGPEQQHQLEI